MSVPVDAAEASNICLQDRVQSSTSVSARPILYR